MRPLPYLVREVEARPTLGQVLARIGRYEVFRRAIERGSTYRMPRPWLHSVVEVNARWLDDRRAVGKALHLIGALVLAAVVYGAIMGGC